MNWNPITIDEFAMFQRDNGMNLRKIDGFWWAEVKPFFFRPLFPFAEIYPYSKQYPLKSKIGGFQHVVASGVAANSHMNFFVYDDLQSYSIEKLSSKRRNTIRKGQKNFITKQINDVSEFVTKAYDIYVSFYSRTGYAYKKERLNKVYFSSWAETLFKYPKILIIGIYYNDRLCAVSISYLVEKIIFDATFFSDTPSQKLQVSDFIVHKLRKTAVSSNAKYIFMGMSTGKRSLDESKLMRGCKKISKPAYYKINPIVLFVARTFMKNSYRKLIGLT